MLYTVISPSSISTNNDIDIKRGLLSGIGKLHEQPNSKYTSSVLMQVQKKFTANG
ncbi:hypothetical protein KPL47_05960 [Clostridium estertheticum]|uniref:hypothetical protein n=1 Tax=Clostridium estertheticum TaxID=238834 RepID=UPI001C0CF0E3|nr:hypothetical protein [Clostridium estertheticum]MBU3175910.1 hypothetical protein [Clostridium estertheticum]